MFYINEAATTGNTIIDVLNKFIKRDWYEIKLSALVSDTSYTVEYFVKFDKNDEFKQNYELVDEYNFDKDAMDKALEKIAKMLRKDPKYESGKVNRFNMRVVNGKIKSFDHKINKK